MASIHKILLHHTETEPPRAVESARITPTGGIDGDSHASGREHRRVLATDLEVLGTMGLFPGDLREQITITGMQVDSLDEGVILQIGSARAKVLGPCAPCLTIGSYLGVADVESFRDQMTDRRGRFLLFEGSDGVEISVGDEVRLLLQQ